MVHVDLCTEARGSFAPDGMKVLLTLRMEGLSMQASLRKLQESADQLLTAFIASGIDPASFEIRSLHSNSSNEDAKQSALLTLCARMAASGSLIADIWQIVSSMPFTVEMDISFYLDDVNACRQTLEDEALVKAQIRALKLCELSGCSEAKLSSLDFEWKEETHSSKHTLRECAPAETPEEGSVHALPSLLPPEFLLSVCAKTQWTFEN